jgi:excisionase family DNA binding protein
MFSKSDQTAQSGNKTFLDISTAASRAGFSIRHFRRIVDEDKIPTIRIGRKFFILASDFEQWKSTKDDLRTC